MTIDPYEIIRLHDGEDLSFSQIADRYKVARSTVSSAYYRTKRRDNYVDEEEGKDIKLTRAEDLNNLVISAEIKDAADIHTLPQLLSYCEVDLDVWDVTRHLVNKWSTPRKEIYKDLTWDKSVMSGTVRDTGQLTQTGLIQVKAWLTRKVPIAILPKVEPVVVNVPLTWAVTKKAPKSGRSLISSDWHIGFWRDVDTGSGELVPFHDRQAIATFVELAAYLRPDRIDLLGDLLDLPEWSDKFTRSPGMKQATQPAIQELAFWLTKLRAVCPDIPIFVYEGNHGARLRKALMNHLPAAYNLRAVDKLDLPPAMSIPNLLGLDALGIQWVGNYPEGCSYLGPVRLEHGDIVRQGPGDTVKAVLLRSDESSVFGHNHRLEKAHRTLYRGNKYAGVIFAASSACLCSIEPGVVPGHTVKQNWQNGAINLDYELGSQAIDPHLLLFQRGTALVEGFAVRGEPAPYLEELRDTFKPWLY